METNNYRTIEELINQKEFKSLQVKAVVSVKLLHTELVSYQERILKKYHITTQQFNVLRILRGVGESGLMVSTLKHRLVDKNSDTSRLVDRLEFAGLVSKYKDEDDKRKTYIKITPKAADILHLIDIEEMHKLPAMFNDISEKDLTCFIKLIEEVINKTLALSSQS